MLALEVRNLFHVYFFFKKIIKIEQTQYQKTGLIAENFKFPGLSYLIKFPIKQTTMDKNMKIE